MYISLSQSGFTTYFSKHASLQLQKVRLSDWELQSVTLNGGRDHTLCCESF